MLGTPLCRLSPRCRLPSVDSARLLTYPTPITLSSLQTSGRERFRSGAWPMQLMIAVPAAGCASHKPARAPHCWVKSTAQLTLYQCHPCWAIQSPGPAARCCTQESATASRSERRHQPTITMRSLSSGCVWALGPALRESCLRRFWAATTSLASPLNCGSTHQQRRCHLRTVAVPSACVTVILTAQSVRVIGFACFRRLPPAHLGLPWLRALPTSRSQTPSIGRTGVRPT